MQQNNNKMSSNANAGRILIDIADFVPEIQKQMAQDILTEGYDRKAVTVNRYTKEEILGPSLMFRHQLSLRLSKDVPMLSCIYDALLSSPHLQSIVNTARELSMKGNIETAGLVKDNIEGVDAAVYSV